MIATHSLKCEKYAFSDKKRSNAAETKEFIYFNFKFFSTFYIWRLIYHNMLIEFDEFTVTTCSYGNLYVIPGPSRVITSALSLISRGITFDMTK
jgi:hypothetical protein